MRIMLFSGTSEGRRLAEFCKENHIEVQVHVATDYGQKVMESLPAVVGRMSCSEMAEALQGYRPDYVVDATHPYAVEVTGNIRRACQKQGVSCLRLLRESEDINAADMDNVVVVGSIAEAVDYLNHTKGNILITTGSKELAAYTRLDGYRERIYVRALPSESVEKECQRQGLERDRLILAQGPFSVDENRLHIRKCRARYLVTKESGSAGGFQDKLQAAGEEKIACIVVKRPTKEEGYSLSEVMQILKMEKM